MDERQRVVVVVEDADAARTALRWAAGNFFRRGDWITLLYIFPSSRSRTKQRNRRLQGFQLALSFKDLCGAIPEARVEIIVKEGDQGAAVVSLVNEIRASTLVLGLHDQSFLYKTNMPNLGMRNLNCRILAVKQHPTVCKGFVNLEFSQVEIARLCIPPPKIPYQIFPYQICPDCLWRRSRRRKGRES